MIFFAAAMLEQKEKRKIGSIQKKKNAHIKKEKRKAVYLARISHNLKIYAFTERTQMFFSFFYALFRHRRRRPKDEQKTLQN